MTLQTSLPTSVKHPAKKWRREKLPVSYAVPDQQALDAGYRRLAGAILARAITDAQKGDPEAAAWLAEDGKIFFELIGLGLQPNKFDDWLAAGCPKPRKRR